MAQLRRKIGSLNALFAFEAAGRLASFTRAAQELNVSQAAVSKQISALETALDQRLFVRVQGGVRLSQPGAELYASVSTALGNIAFTVDALAKPDAETLTIALSADLSRHWLTPLLPELTRDMPHLHLRVVANEGPRDLSDDIDLTITYQDRAQENDYFLLNADVLAMATQDFIAQNDIRTMQDVIAAPRIEYDAPDWRWVDWEDWKKSVGAAFHRNSPTLSFTRYQDALAAARLGQGSILAWRVSGKLLDEDNRLKPLPGPVIQPEGGLYLRVKCKTKLAERACAWLIAHCPAPCAPITPLGRKHGTALGTEE